MTVAQIEQLVGKKEVAERFGVSPRKVGYWLQDGLPSVMLDGRRKFRLSEVEGWLVRSGRLRSSS